MEEKVGSGKKKECVLSLLLKKEKGRRKLKLNPSTAKFLESVVKFLRPRRINSRGLLPESFVSVTLDITYLQRVEDQSRIASLLTNAPLDFARLNYYYYFTFSIHQKRFLSTFIKPHLSFVLAANSKILQIVLHHKGSVISKAPCLVWQVNRKTDAIKSEKRVFISEQTCYIKFSSIHFQ